MKSTVENIFAEMQNDSLGSLKQIAYAEENIIQQDYQNRYFFELIQNCRDANVKTKTQGKIKFLLDDNNLYVGNTGSPFTEEGLKAICRIGQSEKRDIEFIGHKGIGFISILEITANPTIVTKNGTIYFDKQETSKKFKVGRTKDKNIAANDIPLFSFPHFKATTIKNYSEFKNYETLLILPLKDDFSEDDIFDNFDEVINAEQILLLGYLSEIEFVYGETSIKYTISQKNSVVTILKEKDGEEEFTKYFFIHSTYASIDTSILKDLTETERQIYSQDKGVEIKFALEIDSENQFVAISNADYYLFYPLEDYTGLNFIIHSHFSVDPARKHLKNTQLNKFILQKSAELLCSEQANGFLSTIKQRFPNDILQIFSFNRNKSSILNDILYTAINNNLKDTAFIKHNNTFLKPNQIIIGDTDDYNLFGNIKIGTKTLIYLPEKGLEKKWLVSELSVIEFGEDEFKSVIDAHSLKNKSNFIYFKQLYNYCVKFDFKVLNQKVLLTENNELVKGNSTEVYYQIPTENLKLEHFPTAIKNQVTLLNSKVQVDNYTKFSELSGLKLFNISGIVSKLLELFEKNVNSRVQIIALLFQFEKNGQLKTEHKTQIKQIIKLPITNSVTWYSPNNEVIYIETAELQKMYPQSKFLSYAKLGLQNEDKGKLLNFFWTIGVWDCPAILDKGVFNNFDIDQPKIITEAFYDMIYANASFYKSFSPKSKNSSHNFKNTNFYKFLQVNSWVLATKNGKPILSKQADILLFNPNHLTTNETTLLSDFMPVLELKYEDNKSFVEDFGLTHLNNLSVESCINLLKKIKEVYPQPTYNEHFKKFYNLVLSLIFRFYQVNEKLKAQLETQLKNTELLALKNNHFVWAIGSNLLYVDRNKLYEKLPKSIVSVLPAEFTKKSLNDFGKIAKHIGKKLSEIVSISLIKSNQVAKPITEIVANFDYLVLLVEKRIKEKLSENDIIELKKVSISEQETIKVKVEYNGSSSIIDEKYFIDFDNSKIILNNTKNYTNFAKALKDYLSDFVSKELEDFDLRLVNFLKISNSKTDLESFALENDLDIERFEELNPKPISTNLPKTNGQIKTAVKSVPFENIEVIAEEVVSYEIDKTEILNRTNFDKLEISLFKTQITTNSTAKTITEYERKISTVSAEKIGIIAESIIFKILKTSPQQIAKQLGITQNVVTQKIEWFNENQQDKSETEFQDQSKGKGCDIIWHTSIGVFYIEVKGRTSGSIEAYLTYNELKKMKEAGENSLLITVRNISNDLNTQPSVEIIRNPFDKLTSFNSQIWIKKITFTND